MKTMFQILLIINLTTQSCLKGCLKCSSQNTCLLCDTTLFYTSDLNTCTPTPSQNCQTINLQGNCLTCLSNHTLDASTKKCVLIPTEKKVANCVSYSTSQICVACNQEFFIFEGKCKSVSVKVAACEVYGEKGCLECANGYFVSDDGSACESVGVRDCRTFKDFECESCKSGFVKNRNLYYEFFRADSTVEKLETLLGVFRHKSKEVFLDNTVSVCQKIIVENCVEFENFKNCKTCATNFFLKPDKTCEAYPISIIPNCSTYSSNTSCISCNQGYYLVNSSECKIVTTIKNCSEYSQTANTTICTKCLGEHYLANGLSCSLRNLSADSKIENCKSKSENADRCFECNSGFVLSNGGDECAFVLANCLTHDPFTKNDLPTCDKCIDGFYLSNSDCVSGNDPNCVTYQNTGVCDKCKNGYYHNGSTCLKHITITNCGTYHNTKKNTCLTCINNTYNFEVVQTCKLLLEIPFCTSYNHSSTATTASCSGCQESYFLNGTTSCDFISVPNCKSGNSTRDCTHCKTGYVLFNNGSKKECRLPHDYMTAHCETLTNTGETNGLENVGCAACAKNAIPVDDSENYVCVSDEYLKEVDSIGVVTVVEGCVKYESRTECAMCESGKFLRADKLACVDNCGTDPFRVFLLKDVVVGGVTYKYVEYADSCDIVDNNGNVAIYAYDYEFEKYPYKCKDNTVTSIYADMTTEIYTSNVNFREGSPGNWITDVNTSTIEIECPTNATNINGTGTSALITNCEFYIVDSAPKFGCAKCKHGYHGKSEPLGKYITSCNTRMTSCDSSTKYGNLLGTFSQYISCHKCNNTNEIPFFIYKMDSNNDIEIDNFKPYTFSPNNASYSTTSDNHTVECLNYSSETAFKASIGSTNTSTTNFLITDCGLGLFNIDLTNKSDAFVTKCAACKPGYKPGDNEPSKVQVSLGLVTSCTKILNCKGGSWFNACSECEDGFVFRVKEGVILYSECVRQKDGNCFATDAEDKNCLFCVRGFFLNGDGVCVSVDTPKCQAGKFVPFYKMSDVIMKNSGYLFWYSQQGAGCNKCDTGYVAVKYDSNYFTSKSCAYDTFLSENGTNFPKQSSNSSPSNYINNCESYAVGDTIKCAKCNTNFVLRENGSECITLLNCMTALNNGNFCKICKPGFGLVNKICLSGNIANCSTYNTTSSQTKIVCESCNEGFYRTTTNTCLPGAVSNCLTMGNSASICQKCKPGYFKILENTLSSSHDYCQKTPSSFNCSTFETTNSSIGGKITCTTCSSLFTSKIAPLATEAQTSCLGLTTIEHCSEYNTSTSLSTTSLLCKKCLSGFFLSQEGHSCLRRTVTPLGCADYEEDEDLCLTCNIGTFLQSDKRGCVEFPSGVVGCVEYIDKKTCVACGEERWLNAGLCVEVEQEARVENCERYASANVCKACFENFFLEGNLCVALNVANCLKVVNKDACGSCVSGFRLRSSNGKTTCESFTKPNCKVFEQSEGNKCTLCHRNFYINANGECTSVASIIENCLINASYDTCLLCDLKFAISKNKKKCEYIPIFDNNCSKILRSENRSCAKCDAGFFFEENACTGFGGTNSIANGCFRRDLEEDVCLVCDSGFFMNSAFRCLKVDSREGVVVYEEGVRFYRVFLAVFWALLF